MFIPCYHLNVYAYVVLWDILDLNIRQTELHERITVAATATTSTTANH